MSSALQSVLTSLQQNNYVTLAILTAVGYDYVLTLPSEIDYIWSKPWTWVSTLFILVRYFGLYHLVVSSLVGSSFLPGPAEVFVSTLTKAFPVYPIRECFQGKTIIAIRGWALLLFLGAADLVTILRVWAMYNRSRLILGTLLTSFSLEIISLILTAAIQSDARNLTAVTFQILDFSVCFVDPTSFIWANVIAILQITHGTAMCILAIVKFVRESLEMYRATKKWKLNQYMSLLLQQGILYFLVILLFSLINVLVAFGKLPTGESQLIVIAVLQYVPVFTLTPRFIMSIRELHARDVQGRRGGGIDTGFGLSSSNAGAGEIAVMFANVGGIEGLDDFEEIPMTQAK